jgi:nucleoside-diphosphate-sugar epimerase
VPTEKNPSGPHASPKIGITGGTGFIGIHVRKECAQRGIPLSVLARDSARHTQLAPMEKFVSCDINQPSSIDTEFVPPTLIHLAWNGLVDFTSTSHLEEEMPLQSAFLGAMVKSGVQNLIVSGTCFEYGKVEGEIDEQHSTAPVMPYSAAKNELRKYLQELQKTQQFNLSWCRLFYIYGDGQRRGTLYSGIKKAIAEGDFSFEVSKKSLIRDFISVQEVAKLLVDIALIDKDIGPINVCSGKGTSIGDFVHHVAKMGGAELSVTDGNRPLPDFESAGYWGDVSKLSQLVL